MIQKSMIYSAAPNSPVTHEEAMEYGPLLKSIEESSGRKLRPTDVVELARNPRSPLHRFFDWNDASAAHKHRLWRARQLISHVRVLVVDEKGRRVPEKLFFNVRMDEGEKSEKVYVSIDSVMENADLKSQVVAQALREARSWAAKYRRYEELDEIRIVIAKVVRRIRPKRKKK